MISPELDNVLSTFNETYSTPYLSYSENNGAVYLDSIVGGEEIHLVLDTLEKVLAYTKTAHDIEEYLYGSLHNVEKLCEEEGTSEQANFFLEAVSHHVEFHSAYSSCVALWKFDNSNEDVVNVMEKLIGEFRISKTDWVYTLGLPVEEYHKYEKEDKKTLEGLFDMG